MGYCEEQAKKTHSPTPTRFKAETYTAYNLDPLAPELVEPALDLEPEPASPFERLLFSDTAATKKSMPEPETTWNKDCSRLRFSSPRLQASAHLTSFKKEERE